MSGYRSTVVDLYKRANIRLQGDLDVQWTQFLGSNSMLLFLNVNNISVVDGYKNGLNALMKDGLMDSKRGSRHLDEDGYIIISKYLMRITPESRQELWSTTVFGWGFYVLMWNLMSRPECIECIQLTYVTWKCDALLINEQGELRVF